MSARLKIPGFLEGRLRRPVAVFGQGISGGGAAELLGRLGAGVSFFDRRGTEFTPGAARAHALVVYSPGFPLHHPWLEAARQAGCVCLPELDLAALFWSGRILAVTGTNGKTTLTEFLAHALGSVGRPAFAAGNIGVAFSSLAARRDGGSPEETVVCEVSSFQAEQTGHLAPDGLLWTNFAEDHLERHGGMDAYFHAKWELVVRTPPARFFAGSSVGRYARGLRRPLPPGSLVETEGLTADPALAGTPFEAYPQRENFVLASAWWRAEGLAPAALAAAARTFRVGRHRLQRVATVDGVSFWNDSKATNFHAVEAALAGFAAPVILIAGGRSKGGDLPGFARRIAPRVSRVMLIGETGPALGAALSAAGVPASLCATLEDAVRSAAAAAAPGTDVVLSPGFASFDMFRSYEERGDRFERTVAELSSARV